MAACVGPVLGRAIVADHFSGPRAAQLLSALTVVLAVTPVVAPLLGGQLLRVFDWHAIFWALGAVGLVLAALVAVFLGESLETRSPDALKLGPIARNMGAFLADSQCRTYAFIVLLSFAAQFSYISGFPFVAIEVFGVAPEQYGFFPAATGIALIIGAAINGRLVTRFPQAKLLTIGLAMLLGSGALLAAVAFLGGGLGALFAPLLVFVFGIGFVSPNATAAALQPVAHARGSASSVLGVFQMLGGGLAGWAVNALYDGTARPMALTIAVLAALALLVDLLRRRAADA
jgi:DHA1 family bicyclomycin/chloramphenicol resistance-like MFS transporter